MTKRDEGSVCAAAWWWRTAGYTAVGGRRPSPAPRGPAASPPPASATLHSRPCTASGSARYIYKHILLFTFKQCCGSTWFWASWIRIRIISQRYGSGSGSFYHQPQKVRKTLIHTALWLLFDFLSLKMMYMYLQKSNKQKNLDLDLDPDPPHNVMDPQHCLQT